MEDFYSKVHSPMCLPVNSSEIYTRIIQRLLVQLAGNNLQSKQVQFGAISLMDNQILSKKKNGKHLQETALPHAIPEKLF